MILSRSNARRLALCAAIATAMLAPPAMAKQYLLVWSGDQVLDDGVYGQPDFLAVVDATPGSSAYGRVVNTALMPAVFGQHLLSESENVIDNLARMVDSRSPAGMGDALDGGLNLPSSTLNESHHFNAELYSDPTTGRQYLYLGGLISSNIFACDVTDPLHIKPVPGTTTSQADPMTWTGTPPADNICGLAVGSRAMKRTSGVDDMKLLPNGNIVASNMGYKGAINGSTPWPLGRYTIARMEGIARDASRFPDSTMTPTLQTPGGLLEFDKHGRVLGEYPAAVPLAARYPAGPLAGQRIAPLRFRARGYLGELSAIDTGPEAHPHGIDLRADLDSRSEYWGFFHPGGMSAGLPANRRPGKGILAISDYADPLSLAVSSDMDMHVDHGTTVRFFHLNRLKDGPYAVVQMPDGARVESVEQNEEPEGLMAMAMTNGRSRTGMFVASMGGGAIYYSHDVTAPRPEFTLVYDFGPGSGPSVFFVTADDRHLVIPKGSMISPHMHDANGSLYNRDRPNEHDREVVVLDIQALVRGNHRPMCGAAPASMFDNSGAAQRGSGLKTTVGPSASAPPRKDPADATAYRFWPNNGASDCPVAVSKVKFNTPANIASMGGPHIVVPDQRQERVAVSQYFVDLRRYPVAGVWTMSGIDPFDPFHDKGNNLGFRKDFLPGTGSVGDNTVCMMKFEARTGALALESRFSDFTTDGVKVKPGCISWERKSWPHGTTGHASPHSITFMETR